MVPLPQLLLQVRNFSTTTQACQNPELHRCTPAPQLSWQLRVAPDSKQGSNSGNAERAPHELAPIIASPTTPRRTNPSRKPKFATRKPTSTLTQFNLDFAERAAIRQMGEQVNEKALKIGYSDGLVRLWD